jgi:hypothetical protein
MSGSKNVAYHVSISSRSVTAGDFCRILTQDHDVMREQAKEYICEQIDKLTLEELFDRFWEGRKQYGGAFDIEAIPVRRWLALIVLNRAGQRLLSEEQGECRRGPHPSRHVDGEDYTDDTCNEHSI